ncbi:MAG: T9SS C-terminal target domain-containing protein [Bacteroidia bacterium]|nr:MAG: T9SS C-terminal target domain-containing protein [Bacteroidia bacterium]
MKLSTMKKIVMIMLFAIPVNSIADEIYVTMFENGDLWWADGSMTGYNEKTYIDGDWHFHAVSAVRGAEGESYGGSSYSFRDREVFTVHNTGAVNGMTGFSLQLRDWMLGSGKQRDLNISYDGGDNWETLITINKDWFDAYQVYQEYSYVFPGGPQNFAAGDFQLQILGGDNVNEGRINIGMFAALGEMTTVATPAFDPAGGIYFDAISVNISTSTPEAQIYYTLNGDDPTENDILFTDPIDIDEDVVIKARAFKEGLTPSNVATVEYQFRMLVLEKDFQDDDLFSGGWIVHDYFPGANTWVLDDFANITYAMITEFNSQPEYPHSWFISPEVDFNGLENINFSFYNQTAFRTGDALSVHISDNYTGSGDPADATWTTLDATYDPHTGGGFGSWTFSGNIDLSAYGGTVHIGFQYESDADNFGRWHINDILITATETGLSSDVSLAVFNIGGISVLNLGGLEVDDPEVDPGAILYVDDFFEFGGIEVVPNDVVATYAVTLNGNPVAEEDLDDLPISFEDVIVVTVTAEDQSNAFYKVTTLGENRILVVLTPEEGDEFFTYDDMVFTWEAENLEQLLFELFMIDLDDPVESVVIPADLDEIVEEVANGIHGTFFYRLTDNNDPSFFAESGHFQIIDNVDPSLVSKYPESGATNVELNPQLMMEFDEMFIFAGDGAIIIEYYEGQGDNFVAYIEADSEYVSIDGGNVYISLPEPLLPGNTYSVLVDDNAFADMAGNYFPGFYDGEFWTFTTIDEDEPDGLICNGDFEDWTDGLPDCWYGSKSNIGAANVNQYSDNPYSGNYAAQLVNTSGDHRRFTSQPASVENGTSYNITFWVKGQGDIRTGLFDDRDTGFGYAPYNTYISVNSDSWSEYSQVVTAANSSDIAEFIFSLRNTNEGMNHILLDMVSVEVLSDDPEEVATIAELRAGQMGASYTLTGEAILTYQMSHRNQKYIQDDTAGILIDDNNGIITTSYNRYDGITGLTGTLTAHNQMLQFIPTEDPGPATSTNNEVVPLSVSLGDVSTVHQARLITIAEPIYFEDAGAVFATGTNYDIYNNLDDYAVFRTLFFEADYIGNTIPGEPILLTALVSQFMETIQLTARDSDDMEIFVNVVDTDLEDIILYPNPFRYQIHIGANKLINEVVVFSTTGQKLMEKTPAGSQVTLRTDHLQPGLYIISIRFEDGTFINKKMMKR